MAIYHDLDNTGQEVQQRLDQVPVTQADLAEEVLSRQAAVGAVQNNVDAEELRAKAAEKLNADDIDAIEEKIPSGASSSNKLATVGDVSEKIPSTARENADISSLDAAIEAILLLIPSAATSLNKLADKAFVNSSIATATATFRGTKNLVSDLNLAVDATHEQIAVALSEAVSGADNNDYAFVQVPTSSGTPTEIRVTERYKFDGTAWSYEYDLNNSGFTSDQWAAINSTITSGLVDKLNALPSNADLTAALGILTNGIAAINEKIPTAATSSNKLVDTAAMQSYITQILDGIDATFNVTSTDGHVTIQVTQVNGVVTNVAVTTSDIASAADVAQLFELYNALQQSEPVVVQPTDTWPVANPSTTDIYRVIDRVNTPPQNYSDYMFSAADLTTPILMATYNNAIDQRPKKGSTNLVSSGGVFDNMGALDVSELNATENPHTPAIYADLSAALAAIPSGYQGPGMSIKFIQGTVQSVDNKYVQYRLMSDTFNTTPANWQGVDDVPTVRSKNLVESGGIFSIKEGNLIKENGISVVDIDMSNMTKISNLLARISDGHLSTVNNWNVRYIQINEDCKITYKLGVSVANDNAAIFTCNEVPSTNVVFSNAVPRVSKATGDFTIRKGQYLCVQDYSEINTYLPQALKKESVLYEPVNIFDELGEKSEGSTILADNLWNAIEEVNQTDRSTKKIPYLIENASYFWMKGLATNFNQTTPFKISGSASSKTLNILSGGQVSSVLTDDDIKAAVVIKDDNGNCTPHVLISWTENTLEVYPTLTANISSGELVPLYNDAQHLTKLGYHCWAEHIYAANPRYSEKNLYITRYAPADAYQTSPFTQFGGGLANYTAAMNDNPLWRQRYGGLGASYYTPNDALTQSEYGVKWENSTGSYKGYLEAMIGTVAEQSYLSNYDFEKDEGFEMHIEVYADDVSIFNYLKTTNYVERICVPFESGQNKIELKVYYTKLRAHHESISIDMATLWVNEVDDIPQTLFPKYSILSWFMASWGEYWNETVVTDWNAEHFGFPDAADYPSTQQQSYTEYRQGASGEAMRELISKNSGIQVPIYIRSKAGMTTRFGKAWWPFLVQPYHPNIMVTSFGINDHNTNTNPGQFKDILDPYGNIIDMSTPVTALEYADNIKAMIQMCHNNNITFIHAESTIGTLNWMIALENNLSTQIT